MSGLTLGDKTVFTFSILTGRLLNIATHWADYNPATSVVLIWPGIVRRGFNRPQMRKHPGKKLHSLHNVSISLPVKSSLVYLVPINIPKTSFHRQPSTPEEVIRLRTTMWCLCLTFLHSKLVQIRRQLSFVIVKAILNFFMRSQKPFWSIRKMYWNDKGNTVCICIKVFLLFQL